MDEAEPDPKGRVKRLPADLDYVQHIAAVLQREPLLWIPKSRQMLMTWLCAAELVWRMLQPRTHVFVQGQKEEYADWLVRERLWFVYAHLPDWLKYIALAGKVEPKYTSCRLTLANGSTAWGVAQGANQFRGFTPSAVFVDEAAYQDEFGDAHTALLPLSQKGAVMRFVSSAKPSYFSDVVTGGIEGAIDQPLRGIREWNLQQGGHVLRVHHTADPAKDPGRDGKVWVEELAKKFAGGVTGSQWRQEMDIDHSAYEGQKVYPEWSAERHVVVPFDLRQHTGPYWRSIDYGIRNPTACLWVTELDGVYYVIREFYQAGLPPETIKQALHALSPPHELYDSTWIDPHADRIEQIGTQSALYHLNHGDYSLGALKAQMSSSGIDLIRQWFHDGRLRFFHTCTNLIREIDEYRYEDWGDKVGKSHNLKEKPIKKGDHTLDALKYFANGVCYRDAPVEPMARRPRTRRDELTRSRRTHYMGGGGIMRGFTRG